MQNYSITSPSIEGLLSDDYLYFEGLNRPSQIYKIRDGEDNVSNNVDVLEKYFNDIYNLFLRKLSNFTMYGNSSVEEITKLQALLQELIKTKNLIINTIVNKKDGDLL